MKKLLLVLLTALIPFGVFADTLMSGAPIHAFSFKDQFEKSISPTAQTKQVIVAFTKAQGESIKTFLDTHPNYLQENNAIYLMDASAVPGMIMSMFMLPKFKKYDYSIGLIEDEKEAGLFPQKENHLTVISLENHIVTDISFKQTL